jgi:hypothetical protein
VVAEATLASWRDTPTGMTRADSELAGKQPDKATLERDFRWLGEAMVKHYAGDDADVDSVKNDWATVFADV